MTELAKKLNISGNLILKLSEVNEGKVMTLSQKCLSDGFSVLKKENDVLRLAVILQCAKMAKEKYDRFGISEEIYYSTMSDIRIWCENNGNKGLKNYGWLKNHVCLELFRLGRLQFQIYPCKNKTLLYKKLPFSYGENLVYIHIPQGEKLLESDCRESIKIAGAFFEKYFPKYTYNYYFCESWLLFEGNRSFMKKDSNIVSFMNLFTHAYSVKIDQQAIERIYKKRRLFVRNYPETTSLQKSAKKYMEKGGKLGVGVAYIDKSRF